MTAPRLTDAVAGALSRAGGSRWTARRSSTHSRRSPRPGRQRRSAGQPIAVLFTPGARSALDASDIAQAGVCRREVDGQALTFRAEAVDRFVDEETGTVWDMTDQGLSGPLTGRHLAARPHTVVFWFAWGAFQPGTRLVCSHDG